MGECNDDFLEVILPGVAVIQTYLEMRVISYATINITSKPAPRRLTIHD